MIVPLFAGFVTRQETPKNTIYLLVLFHGGSLYQENLVRSTTILDHGAFCRWSRARTGVPSNQLAYHLNLGCQGCPRSDDGFYGVGAGVPKDYILR